VTGWARFRAWLGALVGRTRLDRQMDAEFQFHVDSYAADLIRNGLSPAEAHRRARVDFGSVAAKKDDCRASLGVRLVDELRGDTRYALRAMRRSSGFTAIAILTLALGIGPNSAIFAVVDAVVFRPLPYADPDRLMSLWTWALPNQPQVMSVSGDTLGGNGNDRYTIAAANLVDYRVNNPAFSELAGFAATGANLTGDPPEHLFGEKVSANFFHVLGVQPVAGRAFLSDDDQPGHDQVIVITHALWQRRFGGDPALLGRDIALDDRLYRVIGILAPSFKSPYQLVVPEPIAYFVPAAYTPTQLADRTTAELNVIGRLRSGVSPAAAQVAMDTISSRLETQFPATNRNIRVGLAPLREDIASGAKTPMLALAGAVGAILFIACMNLANLLVAKAVSQAREVTIRFALGATRARVIRGLLVHHVVLALLGCLVGLTGGVWTTQALVQSAPHAIPRLETAALDARVMAFTVVVSVATALLFGLLPAWQTSKARPAESLRATDRAMAGRSVLRWRGALMVAELGLSMMLLVGAGLLLKSFLILRGIDVGFDAGHVVAMNVNLPAARYGTPQSRIAFFNELATRVAALPGVEATAFANRMPVRGGWSTAVLVDDGSTQQAADGQAVSPGYFRTLGIPVLRGRAFTTGDRSGAAPVVIVNAAFGRAYLRGQDAVGHRLRWAPPTALPMTIVGVVADVHRDGLSSPAGPQVYFPAAQPTYPVRLADFAFRATTDPKALVGAVEQVVWTIDKDQPVTRVGMLEDLMRTTVAPRAFEAILVAAFALLALTLALVGVYGVAAYSVSQRTREIGLRMALGATRTDIVRMVVAKAAALIGGGILVGAAAAWVLSRTLTSLLFHVAPSDPATYVGVALVLASVSLLACWLPARRASILDPTVALRQD
jgi:predicted permease